jgi:hypothetical protein
VEGSFPRVVFPFIFGEALSGGLPKGGVSPVFSRIIKMIADQ